jgi:hypothetical protein
MLCHMVSSVAVSLVGMLLRYGRRKAEAAARGCPHMIV